MFYILNMEWATVQWNRKKKKYQKLFLPFNCRTFKAPESELQQFHGNILGDQSTENVIK